MTRWTLLFTLALLSGCTSPPMRPDNFARGDEAALRRHVEQVIAYEMRKSDTPGLSIALVDDQRVIWAQGYGYADQERKIPATERTIYRVGSISKLFTDAAALQLAEQGRLNIDAPLRTYLPEFSIKQRLADTAPITLRDLMTHHAGLPRDVLKGFQTAEPAAFDAILPELRDDHAAYAPGQTFYYSNVGVTLLGSVIQRVTDEPFAAHMRRSVLIPLGMSDSSFESGASASPLMAKSHHGLVLRPEPPMRDLPAGGLNASVVDLSRFISMVFADGMAGSQRLLRGATVQAMLRPQNSDVALDLNFQVGLGWMLSTLGRSTLQGAGVVAHHAGSIEGFRSQLYLLPQHKLGVVVLANSDTATPVVDRVATETLAAALEVKTGIRQPTFKRAAPSDQPVPEATAAALVGDYTTLAGPARVLREGGRLRIEAAGRTFNLVQRTDGLFAIDYAVLGVLHLDLGTLADISLSLRRVDGHDVLVASVGAQEMLVGERVEPPADLGKWRGRLGEYRITNLGRDRQLIDRIRLTEQRGFLVAELTMTDSPGQTGRLLLMPLSDTEAILLGALNNAGETVRVQMIDGEERLVASGYQARRIPAP
jgi:CubicO group peptidase (beta-lactamase class C family)